MEDTGGRAKPEPISAELNRVSHVVIGAAIEVHRHLGPGYLESIYKRALVHELQLQGLKIKQEVPLCVKYKGIEMDEQRLDVLVEPGIVVELKAVESLLPVHKAQLMSYLKTTGCRLGLLINFQSPVLRGNIKRIVL